MASTSQIFQWIVGSDSILNDVPPRIKFNASLRGESSVSGPLVGPIHIMDEIFNRLTLSNL